MGKARGRGNSRPSEQNKGVLIASGKWKEAHIENLMNVVRHLRRVNTILSMQDLALLLVFKFGPAVFESRSEFVLWLTLPNPPLGGKTPLKLLTSNKAKMVLAELQRIEYGIVV